MLGCAAALGAVAVGMARPDTAQACGGFFCSRTPVDQSGETVIYGMEADGTVTMSVQIQYQGNDDDFAWILPVAAPPTEISVGSEALFDALHAATNPVFAWETRVEGACRDYPACTWGSYTGSGGGCGMSSASPSGWRGDYVDAAVPDPTTTVPPTRTDPGVTVYGQEVVGPYETVVLGAATAGEVVTWLGDHGYDVPEQTAPLLEPYAETGHVFVALRLSANRVTGTLRPLTMRIPSSEACLPIRLTAIASVPDMPITAFFLGAYGAAARNYSSVVVDVASPDFWDGTRRWSEAVDAAVEAAGGHAFSTDYSGGTPAVIVELPSVADLAGEPDAAAFLRTLMERGYPGDQVTLELFETFIVPPEGEEARSYYDCLAAASTEACGAPQSFDPAGLARAIGEQITVPREEAQRLVNRHRHLTRLFTTMDPIDMTLDPVFMQGPEVPEVSNVHTATLVTECSGVYYADGAPQSWEIEGESFPRGSGVPADDAAYCEARGGRLATAEEEAMARDSGGCACGVPGAASQGGFVTAAILFLLLRRRRS